MSRLMMMGCGPSGPGAAASVFYSQRVFDLFPQMATASSAAITQAANALSAFGGFAAGIEANGSYVEFAVSVPGGNYKVSILGPKSSSQGKLDIAIDGGAAVDTWDMYNAATLQNQLFSSAQFALSEGNHTIRFVINGKNASSAGFQLFLIHAQLIKQDATSALTSVANVPHVIDVPVVFADSHTNFNTLAMATTLMFGTAIVSSGAQNATITYSFWAPKGGFTLALLHTKGLDRGVYAVSVDGGSVGTIDGYSGPTLVNTLDTTLTGTLATTGMHTITFLMSTKHASSSSYIGAIQHIQIRMTSITEPLSADLAPEVALFWNQFAASNTNWSSLGISSSYAYYHYLSQPSSPQNALLDWTGLVLRPGTYRLDILSAKFSDQGNYHALVDTVDIGNVDAYSAGLTYNNVLQITALVLAGFSPHTLSLKMSDKNASSSNYYSRFTLARLIRTGA